MKKKVAVLILSVIFAFAIAGCEKEGSAEKAGKEIDKTYKKVEKKVSDTVNKVKEKIDETKE